jgi:steroid delta-isomerase-like uncharacterized protein
MQIGETGTQIVEAGASRARPRQRRAGAVGGESVMGIVEEFAAAFNRRDVDGLVACFTADATYDDVFYGRHAGTAELRRMFERMFREGRDYAWRMDVVVADARHAAAEWRFSYTVTDAIPRSAGRQVRFGGMSCFELEDGRVRAYREYADVGGALLQLGFAPAALAKVLARRLPAS